MHNLAIALHKKGYSISGSDDEIFEPSKGRLAKHGLLPAEEGWDAGRITGELDAVILGMHAKADNPELLRTKELGIRLFSYPEYLYEQSKNKKRIVIGGSHGKTTITAMILHVLKQVGRDCDYMVGAQLEGFDVMVRLTEEADCMIFEGDEYLTSPIDRRPKFHLYMPDIALISGIAWDHINVFPTFENYLDQFRIFIRCITPGGTLIYCQEDGELAEICPGSRSDIQILPYVVPDYYIQEGKTYVRFKELSIPLQVFGKHNLMNLNGARMVCRQLGIDDRDFFNAIQSFKGASKRLELIAGIETTKVFKDFAHAPSKVSATIHAVKEQFSGFRVVACLELHTFSSLSREFLSHYRDSMVEADVAMVYFSPHALQLKRLAPITPEQVREGFGTPDLEVYTDSALLTKRFHDGNWNNCVLLMMSSGNFDGMNLTTLIHSSK